VDKGGIILFFATPSPDNEIILPLNDFWKEEIKIMTSYAASPMDLKDALKLIHSSTVNLKEMITHTLSLEETEKGFQMVSSAKESIKVIVEPFR
jgi:L-iditol 2-dehydrogenase